MNRFAAAALAIVGGAICAWVAMMMLFGIVMGVLWLFIFGDDPWPDWVLAALEPGLVIAGLIIWFIMGRRLWRYLTSRPAAG